MREKFFDKLIKEMRKDEKIFFLMGDTGFGLVEPIFEEFPERSLNVGIAEQNMIGIAAGLSNAGFRPVCYAITNFLVFRCLEQIRNDVALHNYPVILVGTSTGFDHGKLWASHYVTDDIGCMKSIPNLNIYSPSSSESIDKIFEDIIKCKNPCYLRISKSDFSEMKEIERINRYIVKNNEANVLVISHGKMIKNSYECYKIFPKFSIFALDKIKPLEENYIEKILNDYQDIVVIEDNFNSGLFNSLCQFVIEKKINKINIHSISPNEIFEAEIGDTETLEKRYGLNNEHIIKFLKNII